ncbi:uncharacterized protein LOC127841419 [Dreissena polymorpha]|uniref:uncharacterized protein LOC127841419 n=1 Tax=Dreissena polymorpha TaxID=45954 RepID=UPI0022645183|nr:uncharacterized protein LOC127841419 [Dreissena polymorpha]
MSELSVESRSDKVEDRTFNISNREIEQPNLPLDDSVRERPLDAVIPEDGPITYDVVTGGTKRGGKKLVSSDGHSYTAKRSNGGRKYWQCSVRNKAKKCYANVKQFGDIYTASLGGHTHPANPGMSKEVKARVRGTFEKGCVRTCGTHCGGRPQGNNHGKRRQPAETGKPGQDCQQM